MSTHRRHQESSSRSMIEELLNLSTAQCTPFLECNSRYVVKSHSGPSCDTSNAGELGCSWRCCNSLRSIEKKRCLLGCWTRKSLLCGTVVRPMRSDFDEGAEGGKTVDAKNSIESPDLHHSDLSPMTLAISRTLETVAGLLMEHKARSFEQQASSCSHKSAVRDLRFSGHKFDQRPDWSNAGGQQGISANRKSWDLLRVGKRELQAPAFALPMRGCAPSLSRDNRASQPNRRQIVANEEVSRRARP